MLRNATPSTLSLAILGLICLGPMSGYDLRKVFLTTPMGHFSTSPGAIYPALRRMEQRGLIKGSIHKKQTLRPKQIYTITRRGRTALKERLTQPIINDDVMWRMDELVLRFAFMGNVVGKEQSLEFLRDLLPRLDAYVCYLKDQLKAERGREHATGAYAVEQGIAIYEATARWSKRVIKALQRDLG
jgi:DNA-binding PadR family transcriptional regulator